MQGSIDLAGLDRPVWASLIGFHAPLSQGNSNAIRFLPSIAPFAAMAHNDATCLSALELLVPSGEYAYLVEAARPDIPPGFEVINAATVLQMVATGPDRLIHAPNDMVNLHADDAQEMHDLASRTQPGPFEAQTHRIGAFIGVRRNKALVAMAGERFRFQGFSEISGVCTDPQFRGEKLAKSLSSAVAQRIFARGETPFLHSWSTNATAIGLYESLGFVRRRELHVLVVQRNSREPPFFGKGSN